VGAWMGGWVGEGGWVRVGGEECYGDHDDSTANWWCVDVCGCLLFYG
jgi:hypothetical protein